MWRSRHGLGLTPRLIFRHFCNKPPGSSTSSKLRLQVEKQKRKREKEKSILQNSSSEETLKWREKERIVYSAKTPLGTKKDTSLPLPASYSPEYVESSWYQWWEKEQLFNPDRHEKTPHAVDRTFTLCIPPPNVTGTLHLGHALTVAVEDALVRRRRMQGFRVLWLPGCDHAGIATQTVVERKLMQQQGKCRHDFTREEFLKEVWKWKKEKGDEIYMQLRKLGASLDWSRACFTMDPAYSKAVTEAFVRLCDAGLIYRSESLVNWSCALESAISDIEVDYKELSGPTMFNVPGYEDKVEFGTMITFAYPLEDHSGEVSVSTTRPETMMGDVAVAVHPDDSRYKDVHGQMCRHPFTDRLLPIITDTSVDMQLGTGAVKLTPAHDHTDFLMSQCHSLPRLTAIGGDGRMTPMCGPWLEGVKRFDARRLIVDALVEKKLFRGKKDHMMNLPVCSRSGDIVEPLLKKQWFVRSQEMAQKSVKSVEEGHLEIIPHLYTKSWKKWMSNINDWCISRQLWWGHQIPAYMVHLANSSGEEEERWVWGRSEDEARQRAAVKYGVTQEEISLTQDVDVLDTWFSSALFPFAMLGWPEQTPDFQRFYPNSLLETGSDLVFFWVARMVMLGTELTGQLPFKQVLLHSLVRDKHGRKMSKSLGNVIDPLDVIHGVSLETLEQKVKLGNLDPREQRVAIEAQRKEFPSGIPECGTDALRFALCSHKMQGEDISMSISQVLSCRHFCNKMWQTVRFTLQALGDIQVPAGSLEELSPTSELDQWICSRLYSTVALCEQSFDKYELHTVTSALHSFWVNNLCDVYLECVKPVLAAAGDAEEKREAASVLYHCVCVSLSLLSPFMPFLTEELWQRVQVLRGGEMADTSLCVQQYPRSTQLAHCHFPKREEEFQLVKEVVRAARSLRAQCPHTKERPALWVVCSPIQANILQTNASIVRILSRISDLHVHCPEGGEEFQSDPPPSGSLVEVVNHTCQVHLPAQSSINLEDQIIRLNRRREKMVLKMQGLLTQVQSLDFQTKVPAHVRLQMEGKLSGLQQEVRKIEEQLTSLEKSKK